MDLIALGLLSFILTSYCFNRGQFSCLLNLNNVNVSEISVKDSTNNKFQEHIYTPKSGVQICKITDGINIIWEDRQKLTQCVRASTLTKNNLIHLVHLEIKRTSKVSEDKFFKRLDCKFVNITEREFDLLKLDPNQLIDNTIYFDINSKSIDDRLFKTFIRPYDGVPTLLLEPTPGYKLISIYDDFRVVWSKKSSSSYVENLIAYYFFTRYYLIMLKLKVNEEEKYACFLYKDGDWLEVEYYTFMNKFLRLKSHIPITGHLSFNILDLPGDEEYSIEKDEKYSIELSTYYPRRGFVLNSVLKGDHIIWESARERCASIRLVKKKGTIYGINLSLMDDHDQRSTLNFVLEDHAFREVSDEDFKKFGKNLVDPSEYQKYHGEHVKSTPKKEPHQPEVIIEEPEDAEETPSTSRATEEVIDEEVIKNVHFEGVGKTQEQTSQDIPTYSESQQNEEELEELSPQTDSEPQLLDIADFNSRLFLKNSFKLDNVDTYEFLPLPGVRVSSIVDGSIFVWDNTKQPKTVTKLYVHHRNELTQLLKLVTRVKTGEVEHFFKRHNATFEFVDYQEFDSLFQKMTTSLGPLDNSILLNLSTTPQEKYFDYYNEFDDGVNVSKFLTKSSFKLTKITDGQHVLWHSFNNDKCSSIIRNKFHRNFELIVVNISLISGMTSKYFKKMEGNFSEINKSVYDSDFKNFKDSIPFISNVSLNINSAPSEVNFLYNEKKEGNFTRGAYYPKSGYVLNKVSSGSNVLWTSTRNRCKQVFVYTDSNSHKLVKLSFSNTTTPELFFNLVNGNFLKLRSSVEFDFTFKELNKPDSDVDPCSFCKSQLEREFTLESGVNKIYLNTNVDTNNFYTCFNPDLVMNKIFVPKDGNAFNNITDGNAVLFNPRSDSELCVYVHLFYDTNRPRLAKLRTLPLESTSKGNLTHLEISENSTLTHLTPDEFKTKLNELKDELNKMKESQNKISLDISSPGPECVEKDGKFRELLYKEFKPNDGYFFSKVVFSQDLVYPLDADEDCILVRPYFFLDFVVLVELNFLVQGGKNTMVYLYRFGNEFTTLDFQHFNNLLRSISDLVSKCEVLELGDFETENTHESKDYVPNTEYNLKNKLFSSGKKYFTTINVKGFKLWSANSDLFLAKNVYVFYQESNPFLVKASLESLDHDITNLFFEFKNNNWNTINYTQYMDLLENNTVPESQEQSVTTDSLDLYDVDISKNTNQEFVSYISGKTNGVFYVEVSLKDCSDGIRSVSENGKLMWESSKQDLVCKKSFVYYFDGVPQLLKLHHISQSNTESFTYKHVSDGYWLDINDDIFNRKLASFESLSKDTRDTEPPSRLLFKLDTSNVDENLVRVTKHAYNNLFYQQYKPIGRNSFVEVVDGTVIWKSDSGHECNLVRIYLYKETSILSKLFLSNDLGVDLYHYFYLTGGKWKKITSNEFESHLDSLTVLISDDESEEEDDRVEEEEVESSLLFEEVQEPTENQVVEEPIVEEVEEVLKHEFVQQQQEPPPEEEEVLSTASLVELNVRELDPKLFKLEKGSSGNVPFRKIKSKENVLIYLIKDNDLTIWFSNINCYCTHIKLYLDNDIPVLAEIIVKSNKSKMKFFKKSIHQWELVDEDVYNNQFDSLKYKLNS